MSCPGPRMHGERVRLHGERVMLCMGSRVRLMVPSPLAACAGQSVASGSACMIARPPGPRQHLNYSSFNNVSRLLAARRAKAYGPGMREGQRLASRARLPYRSISSPRTCAYTQQHTHKTPYLPEPCRVLYLPVQDTAQHVALVCIGYPTDLLLVWGRARLRVVRAWASSGVVRLVW
jgi:hypothetical protein